MAGKVRAGAGACRHERGGNGWVCWHCMWQVAGPLCILNCTAALEHGIASNHAIQRQRRTLSKGELGPALGAVLHHSGGLMGLGLQVPLPLSAV